ncbi:hypothetical protein GALMADRAFT_237283 [Galerina marginata CBS 339.88]|uniref:protein-tyrosine-phosphatase n=1 Tax=Galerina marginata (strain CBS 339.88) TaxID=685588 RepID=A0A067TQ33_GALM3|nr:hypothetical protein GALMADRAFT_237283 [Galerina marginata CBS 339.88]
MTYAKPCVTEILEGQLYLGNLSAASSVEPRKRLSITHIVSVCPDFPSTGPRHLNISVEDSEYENLLIRLPETCRFIQHALEQRGRVLVHCVMGVSRSATVVAAFLMQAKKMTVHEALRFVKRRRPQVHPNYGFIKQLHTFEKCNFEAFANNPLYRSWKRRHEQDVTYFLNHMSDTVSVVPDKLLLSSDFPSDPEQAQSLLLELGVTHLLSISPSEISISTTSVAQHHHVNLDSRSPEAFLLALPDIKDYIHSAIEDDGVVLVHSLVESRACTAASAYLMAAENQSPAQAFGVLEDALPLFNPTRNFTNHLELFQACDYAPTADHPIVKEWIASQQATACGSNLLAASDLNDKEVGVLVGTGFDLRETGDVHAAMQPNPQPYIIVH